MDKMATKTRPSRVETEIDKCRGNGNWAKLEDLARQLSYKSPTQEAFATFIQIESRLERHLQDHPQIGVQSAELSSLQKQLREFFYTNPKNELQDELQMLQAKAHFVAGNQSEALSCLTACTLDKISLESISSRKLRLIAEGYAIQGLCLEVEPSKDPVAHRDVLQCFERAADLGLLQLEVRHDTGSKATPIAPTWSLPESEATAVGPFIETALQKSPLMLLHSGKMSKGIARFRDLLRTVELRALPGLRQNLAKQLAEVLLRGVCEATYEPIELQNRTAQHKPKHYSGNELFVPKNANEEALLLLLLSESISSREAVLDRSPEHAETRIHRLHHMTTIYDLITILLVRQGQYIGLSETFERALKFSFEEFHIWYQFALSLISAQKYARAILVLKECTRMRPDDPTVLLQAAHICLHNLRQVEEGIGYAERVLKLEEDHLRGKAYIVCGVGYSLQAEQARLQTERQEYHRKALNAFFKAADFDINDHLAIFYMALQLAELRKIHEAMKYVNRALDLRPDHWPSLQLLALLLTTEQRPAEALAVVEMAVNQYPTHISLLSLKCKIEQLCCGVDTALQTAKHMLQVWKVHFEPMQESEQKQSTVVDYASSSLRSNHPIPLPSDRDSESVKAESLAASRIEKTLSDVMSSLGSTAQGRPGVQQMVNLQSQIWLQLAELYLDRDTDREAANACINEAASAQPVSHFVSYMKGRLAEHRGKNSEAKSFYENAVSINPFHVKSLQRLAMLLHVRGNTRLAEKILRDAVNADPTAPETWRNLGTVLNALGDHASAIECLLTAVNIDTTTPIMPFSTVPKMMQG